MRLPFFKSAKPESDQLAKVLITPPRPSPSGPQTAARPEITLRANPQPRPAAAAAPTPAASGSNGEKTSSPIPVPLRSILSQLSSQLFVPGFETQLANTTVQIPANLILPQLHTGRIEIRLSDLLPWLPEKALRQPTPIAAEQQTIILSLAEVVAALPADAFTVAHESSVEVDAEGIDQFPNLFDDGLLQEPARAVQPVVAAAPSVAEEEPVVIDAAERPAPPTAEPVEPWETATPIPSAVPAEAVNEVPAGLPENVMVSVRGLVSVLPDHVFACPRADLSRRANFDLRVAVPLAPILPQLKNARVRLPMETIIAALPATLFVSPLPKITGETVPVPLEEIIPQLPSHVFMGELRQTQEQEVEIDESEIPTPFPEKDRRFEDTRPLFAEGRKKSEPEPAPAEAVSEITSEEELEDENLAIFAESTPSPVERPIAETVAEPIAEPVAEATPEVPAPTPQPVEDAVESSQPPVVEIPAPVETVVSPVALPPEQTESVSEVVPLSASAQPPESPVAAESAARDEGSFLVNLNACRIEDLMRVEGIGRALAQRIVEFRNVHGPFKSVEDLRAIPGIGRKTFRAIVGVEPRALNQLLGVEHNQELTLQEIVRRTSALPGVAGCILAMSDGLLLTGQLPEHLDQNTISVFAPQLFKKVGRYARELRVGQIRRLTIFTDQQPVSIFQAGEIFLVIIHDTRHFSKALLRRCERISQEIAHLCRQRAVV
jgi:competence ComEA-like helix-hairpin-helix protein